MSWRGPRTAGGERWADAEYRRNRAILRAQRRPCARCGGRIAYDEDYWVTVNGRRTINRRAFHAGHIVDRGHGGGHELANLQAEHAGCSVRSGAQLGQRRQRRGRHMLTLVASPPLPPTPAALDTSRSW